MLKDDAKPIVAPAYGTKESIARFNFYDAQGVPIPAESGKYGILKRDNGVSRVYSNYDQSANSDNEHLANSNTNGRIA